MVNKHFDNLLARFEKYISDYSFKKFSMGHQETVYLIEDSAIE